METDILCYLQRGEDAGEGTGKQQEDGDGRQLASVSIPEVSDSLDQLRKKQHGTGSNH